MNKSIETGQIIKIDGEKYTIKEFENDKNIILTKYSFDNPIYHAEINQMGNFKIVENYNIKNIQWKLRK